MPTLAFRAFVRTLAAFGLATVAAAQERPRPHPLEPSREWRAAVRAGTHTADGRPGPAHWTDHARYEISAELDPGLARVQGSVRMTYHNRSPEPLRELWVHLRQNLYAPDAVRNVPVAITGGMQIERVQLDGAAIMPSVRGTRMEVTLPEPLPPGGTTTLAMDFAFTVPNGEAPRMGREGSELFFLGYWYPQFAVRDCVRGWVCEPYLGESEFYMPLADYEFALTLPAGWLVTATGVLQNPDDVLTERAQQALQRAATSAEIVPIVGRADRERGEATRASENGKLTWRFRAEQVRDVAIGASSQWQWDAIAADVGDRDGDDRADRCLVQTFYRRQTMAWRPSCTFAKHTIERMSQWVAPYPWPHATVVEGILGGGMEYPMLTLCGDQHTAFAQQSLIAHELAHMWFPMQVGSDETAFGWQDEGLVDFYTELLERDHWRRAAGRRAPSSMRDCVTFMQAGLDREPMLRHADHLQYPESYVYLCYTKPAAVLQQLARWLGEDAVTAALRDYARTWRFLHPTPEDFFASMNRALGQDLDWYWSTWWTETWTLDHAVGAVQNSGPELATAAASIGATVGATVEILDRGTAPHPAFVRVRFADGTRQDVVVPVDTWLGGARTATLTFAQPVVDVQIDPDHKTLDVNRDDNRWSRK